MRLIDLDKIRPLDFPSHEMDGLDVVQYLNALPTIDPEDLRPKAKWKLHKNGDGTCSRCHFTQLNVWDYDNWQKYCGHCGAHMTDAN